MTQANKAAIVTGSGSGLGRAIALDLASDGYLVLVADVNLESAEQTVALMPNRNGSRAVCLDVTSVDSINDFSQRYGDLPIELLVNNAGLQHVAPIDVFPAEKWNQLLDVMLSGAFAMIQMTLPIMRRRSFGRIINIGSIHSCVASPFKAAYTAAKHGLLGLSKVVALETADVDITINTICPAYIRTPLVDAQIDAQAAVHGMTREEVVAKIFLERMPKKAFISYEEVIGAMRYLAGPHARNVTGQVIIIDGGWTLR